jgi:myo-inositol-1(or 4)-monophosphatase
MKEDLDSLLAFARETAFLAGELTLQYFQAELEIEYKQDQTPVTIADRKAEELIRQRVDEHYPHHAVLGEEHGSQRQGSASHCWIIDPIDGTKSFMRGIPLYSLLIGLEIEGDVKVGVSYFPALNEMISAASGLGCWWMSNNKPNQRTQVSDKSRIKDSMVVFTDVNNFYNYNRGPAWDRIRANSYHCSGFGDAYGYLLVATGRAELMLDPIMNIWDCGPFPPILQEAGGYFGDWNGNPTIYGHEAMATTNILLPEVLNLIHLEDD